MRMKPLPALSGALILLGSLVPLVPAAAQTGAGDGGTTNVNMVGEAFAIRQDGTVPTEVLLARYPRAVTEVSDDLSTGFASFADPGFLGRFGIGSGFAATGNRELQAPAWAECLFPQSPQTPTAEIRSPGAGVGPTAVAECRSRGSHLAGYATQPAPDGAEAGDLRGGPLTATVDTEATADGVTSVVSTSEIGDVTIGGVVTLRSIRNQAVSSTTGRPGGATARADATIGALLVNGEPVELPSDSIQELTPFFEALAPVVSGAGTFTFDVVPEVVEAAEDGSSASARAAQLTVTLRTGQTTLAFGLGFARAGARTIVAGGGEGLAPTVDEDLAAAAPTQPRSSPGAPDGTASAPAPVPPASPDFGTLAVPAPFPPAYFTPPALPTGGGTFPAPASGSARPDPSPAGGTVPATPDEPAPSVALPPAMLPAAPASELSELAGGPSKGTVAALGAICAAVLVRYLSYSSKLRRLREG